MIGKLIFKGITSLLGGPIAKSILEGYKAKLDSENTRDNISADLALKDMDAEIARRNAQRDLGIAAMGHPVWWIAWGLFVIPVGIYNAAIFILSTLSIGPETYAVLQVPAEQEALARTVVQYIFLAQGTAGIAGAVIKRLTR